VLAADIPAVREVCGDAARYFSPGDHATLARALSELAAAPPEPGSPLRAGPERAARFSWAQSARVHAEAYSLAAEMASRKHPNRRDR
jgi:glycosyltransferase involved in cell wall biosynthesis